MLPIPTATTITARRRPGRGPLRWELTGIAGRPVWRAWCTADCRPVRLHVWDAERDRWRPVPLPLRIADLPATEWGATYPHGQRGAARHRWTRILAGTQEAGVADLEHVLQVEPRMDPRQLIGDLAALATS